MDDAWLIKYLFGMATIDWNAPVQTGGAKIGNLGPKRLEFANVIGNLYQGAAPPPRGLENMFDAVVLMASEYQPNEKQFEGIEVLHAPIRDTKPAPDEIQRAYAAAKWVSKRLKSGKKVLVSCMAGLNRSGFVSAMALVMDGYNPKSAIHLVKNARGPKALSNTYFVNIIKGMKSSISEAALRNFISSIINESNTNLQNYNVSRDYTSAELEHEVGEFFNNSTTQSTMSNLFSDQDDARQKIKNAPTQFLKMSDINSLQNCDVGEALGPAGMLAVRQIAAGRNKDIERIEQGIKAGTALPPPIIIKDKKGSSYLLGGNTRLMTMVAMGFNPLVKIIDYAGEFRLDT